MPSASAASAQLAFCLLAHLGFEIGIGGDQKPGLAGVDSRLRTVQPRAENLRGGNVQLDVLAFHPNIARLEDGEVNPGNDLAMDEEQNAISGQEIRKERIFLGAAHYFVHGVDHCLQALQPLDAVHYSGLAYVNAEGPACHCGPHAAQQSGSGVPRQQDESKEAEQRCAEKQSND